MLKGFHAIGDVYAQHFGLDVIVMFDEVATRQSISSCKVDKRESHVHARIGHLNCSSLFILYIDYKMYGSICM